MKFFQPRVWAVAAAVLALSACRSGPQELGASASPLQPEMATGFSAKPDVVSHTWAVASANPFATQAGVTVLKAGGSAVDAAIAVQMVLGLVEPQSSGIGGGAFLLHSTATQGGRAKVQAFDGRETAPAAATDKLFLDAQGKPLPFIEGVVSGLSVGVPGTLSVLEMAHKIGRAHV